jgi:hypothetical protein
MSSEIHRALLAGLLSCGEVSDERPSGGSGDQIAGWRSRFCFLPYQYSTSR